MQTKGQIITRKEAAGTIKISPGYAICACLTKPLAPEEFHYWLRCISENLNVKSVLETGAGGTTP